MVEVLSTFPARPPTPPRTTTNAFIDGPTSSTNGHYGLLGTPGDSPSSINGSTNLSGGGRSKRVNFSPWTNYIKPPTFPNQTSGMKNELRALPRSNDCKPSKSILKITTTSPLPSPSKEERETTVSFGMLLESVTQQLAGESLSSRLDAYMHLMGAVKAYEGVPEEQAMVGKLGQLTQFIQRDISRDVGNGDPQDVNLVANALKLAIFLVWNPNMASHLHEDFRIFVIDQSIQALQDAKAPKSVLNHYMHLLSSQNFSAKTMTNTRIVRILSALKDITNFVTGNGIVAQRLSVYQRLLTQSKTTMAAQSNLWMEHFISGLLHQLKDTRSRAISFGMQLSLVLGPNLSVSNNVQDTFNKTLDKGRRLVSEICERMARMMAIPETGIHVPQVWSIIVLLLRSKKFVIAQWEHFKAWVLVLQKCFNCSEPSIKAQAILAWNRFVYAVEPNESTGLTMIRMLSKPILSQLERRKHDKSSATVSQLSLSSYYNLLYYALHPESSFYHLDVVWEEYIVHPFNHTFSTSQLLNDHACRLLKTLLWSSSVKVWNENKINETSRLEPEDVPPMNSRWVRSRMNAILKVFETLFKNAAWNSSSIEDSEIAAAWTSLCKAVSAASEKEIEPSAELMQAVAAVLGMLQRLWNTGASSMNAAGEDRLDHFFERFSFIATTAIVSMGPLPFTEKLLEKTEQETFQCANTPTHRRPATNAKLDTALMYLLRFVTASPQLTAPNTSYVQMLESLVEAGSRGRTSRGSRLDFLEKYSDLFPNDFDSHLLPHHTFTHLSFVQSAWEAIARLTEDCLRSFPLESARERDGTVTRDYDNSLKILQRGLAFPEARIAWSKLLEALIRVVRTERGDAAITKIIIEPVAERVLQLDITYAWCPTAVLIDKLHSLPSSQHNKSQFKVDQIDLGFPSVRHGDINLPEKAMKVIERVLYESYRVVSTENDRGVIDVVEALTSLLGSGVLSFRSSLLDRLQEPLAIWIKDESRHLTTESLDNRRALTAYRSLSLAIANILQSAISHESMDLAKFGLIISAGLASQHKSITNRFIEMWNSTFGLQEVLEYPDNVLTAVRKLEPYVELQLPSLPLGPEKQVHQESFRLFSSQESQADPVQDSYLNGKPTAHLRVAKPRGFSSSPIVSTDDGSGPTVPARPRNLTPRRRLRHEDSQLEFVPVESSPVAQNHPESKVLTAHQKEVKERQRNEISKFLEGLRSSSPGLPSPTEGADVCRPMQLTPLDAPEPVQEIPLTPTLPATLPENEDAFPGSSPTPSAKSRGQPEESGEGSSLSMHALEALAGPEIPSSPPEIKPQEPKRRASTRRRSSRSSKAKRSDPTDKATESAPPGVLTEKEPQISEEANGGDATTNADNTETPFESATNLNSSDVPISSGEVAPEAIKQQEAIHNTMAEQQLDGDIDAGSDDLEMQLASQLEQGLELAVDLDEIRETQSQPDTAPSAPITRKRKREQEKKPSDTPVGGKRRSLRSSAVGARQPDIEKLEKPAQGGKSTPSPSFKAKETHKQISSSADLTTKPAYKRPQDTIEDTEREHTPVPVGDNSSSKRRRSSRLSGLSILTTEEENVAGPSKRKTRSRMQNSQMSNPQNPNASSSQSPLKSHASAPKPSASEPSDKPEAEVDSTSEAMDITNASVKDREIGVSGALSDHGFSNQSQPQYVSDAAQTEDVTADDAVIDAGSAERSILSSLRNVLGSLKRVAFGRETLREMDDLMFDIRFEAQEAVRRQDK